MAGKGNVYLHIDTSDLRECLLALKTLYSPKVFNKMMYRVMSRAATRTKTIVAQEVPADYHAKAGWIKSSFRSPIINDMSCTIPLKNVRGVIGKDFAAAATDGLLLNAAGDMKRVRKQWTGRRGKRARNAANATAAIVKGRTSKLPAGHPPHFYVFSGPLKGKVMVRKGAGRTPIRRAVGIGVPQMPMNRSAPRVQEGVMETLIKRIEHEHSRAMKQYCGRWM